MADDFLLLDYYLHFSSSRHDTIRKEAVADQVDDASPQAIVALKQENNKLTKENEDLRVVILVSSQIAIIVIYICSVNEARHYGTNI